MYFFTKLHSILFRPTKSIRSMNAVPFEDEIVDGVSIVRYIFDPDARTVFFCHGNSGNISNRKYMIDLSKLAKMNLVMFDYHGYGKSFGFPSTRRLMKCADSALKWTLERVDEKDLIIWGESLGGSIASYAATKCNCHKLVLFATFSSLENLAVGINDTWFSRPLKQMFSFIFHPLPTRKWVSKTKCPVLMVHSKNDSIISIDHARHTHSLDPDRIELIEIEGDHSSPSIDEEQIKKVIGFCEINHPVYLKGCVEVFDKIKYERWG